MAKTYQSRDDLEVQGLIQVLYKAVHAGTVLPEHEETVAKFVNQAREKERERIRKWIYEHEYWSEEITEFFASSTRHHCTGNNEPECDCKGCSGHKPKGTEGEKIND